MDKYEEWIEYRVANNAEPLTRTQSLLAREILGNYKLLEMLSAPGDIQSVFKSIQQYLKK